MANLLALRGLKIQPQVNWPQNQMLQVCLFLHSHSPSPLSIWQIKSSCSLHTDYMACHCASRAGSPAVAQAWVHSSRQDGAQPTALVPSSSRFSLLCHRDPPEKDTVASEHHLGQAGSQGSLNTFCPLWPRVNSTACLDGYIKSADGERGTF